MDSCRKEKEGTSCFSVTVPAVVCNDGFVALVRDEMPRRITASVPWGGVAGCCTWGHTVAGGLLGVGTRAFSLDGRG